MKSKIEKLIKELKYESSLLGNSKPSQDAKISAWYVIAKLEEILLEDEID